MTVSYTHLDVYKRQGVLKATVGLLLSLEEEYDGADLVIHKISSSPEREANW